MNTVEAFKKAKFLALLGLCFGAFLYAFGKSITKWTRGDTSVEMEFLRYYPCFWNVFDFPQYFGHFSTVDVTFPALTICPHYNVAYKGEILGQYGSNATQMRKGLYPKFLGSSLEFFKNVTHNFEEIVQEIYISTFKSLHGTDFRYFLYTTDPISTYKSAPCPVY